MITKVKWSSRTSLGDLELDFSKADGSAYKTIILAGENGTGKTTILESLSEFLNRGSIEDFQYIDYVVPDNSQYHIEPIEESARFGFHTRKSKADGSIREVRTNRSSNSNKIESDPCDLRHYGFSYSKARSGFNTNKVTSTTTQQVDSKKYENDSKEDFTSIKQLLVDINTQDNAEWRRITESDEGTSYGDFKSQSKMSRFSNAFDTFFESIAFKEINHASDEIEILFDKHGKSIPMDKLSTGEKQIVFRGAHLLKNAGNMRNGIVLIDEPELSMHPKWQLKILRYYCDLFKKNEDQTAQIIIATHSEYVIKAALEDMENTLIIVLRDNNGTIAAKKITTPMVLPSITSAEINYVAFGIASSDYHIALYGYLQTKTGNNTVKRCDEYIASSPYYDQSIHDKPSSFKKNERTTRYQTLPTYIRNAIDHPDASKTFTGEELERSIELLIDLCKQDKPSSI